MQNSVVAVDVNSGLMFGTGIGTFNLGGLAGSGNFGLADTGGSAVALTVGSAGGDSTYSGNLTACGSLSKVGSGSLKLSCSTLYQRPHDRYAGTLQVDGWFSSLSTSIASNASLVFNGSTCYGGTISGGGQLVKVGTGQLYY